MSAYFEELDYRPTRLGPLCLRRRRHPSLGADIYEIKLGEEFLMSSRFTVSEVALARLGLAELSEKNVDVVVGGLGLGCTARAVLDNAHVLSLLVIEALPEVIEWHATGLLPLGAALMADCRCRLVQGDFFTMIAATTSGLDPECPKRLFHAILVDIDHSPRHVLHPFPAMPAACSIVVDSSTLNGISAREVTISVRSSMERTTYAAQERYNVLRRPLTMTQRARYPPWPE